MEPGLRGIDLNLQAIKGIEAGWDLPAVPDMVALDLASLGMASPVLSDFMYGLQTDIQEAGKAQPLPQPDPGLVPARRYEPQVDLGRYIYGVTGQGAPFQLADDAVRTWKQRAVDGGYLDLSPEEIRDPSWYPEYSYVAREMNFDTMSDQWAGDTPGSLPMDKVWDLVGEWLTPAGLYTAATELGLMWNPEQIASETQEWGQKWEAFAEEPWNPLRLLDALTGPIDDVLFPIINWALMLTGIGEVYTAGRAIYAGQKSVNFMSGIYSGAKNIRYASKWASATEKAWIAGDPLLDAARMAKPSFLANRVFGATGRASSGLVGEGIEAFRGGPVGKGIYDSMVKWRGLKNVQMAKKVNQQVIRLGITSNMQQLLDQRTGISVASETGIDEWLNTNMTNSAFDWAVDLLFVPANYFQPGGLVKGLVGASGVTSALAAPISAAKKAVGVGFERVADNQKLLTAWIDPMVNYLDSLDPSGVKTQEFRKSVSDRGLKQTLADHLTGGDTKALGGAMVHVTVAGMVDNHARMLAQMGRGSLDMMDGDQLQRYYTYRGGVAAKLRAYDPVDVEDVLRTMARYGDEALVMDDLTHIPIRTNRTDKVQENLNRLREGYLEPEDVWAARAGAVPDGHKRLYKYRDELTGDERWTSNLDRAKQWADDPEFVDVSVAEATRFSPTVALDGDDLTLPGGYKTRYERSLGDNTVRHPKLSEAAEVRVYNQEALENLRTVVEGHNDKRQAFLANMMNDMKDLKGLSAYIADTLPSFGNWGAYMRANDELRIAIKNGDLRNVRATPAMSGSNRLSLFPEASIPGGEEKWTDQMFRLLLQLPDDVDISNRMGKSMFDVLARELDPTMGRLTIAKAGTPTKQEALVFAHDARKLLARYDEFKKLVQQLWWNDFAAQMNAKLQAGLPLKGKNAVIEEALAAVGAHVTKDTRSSIRRLMVTAIKENLDLDNIEGLYRRTIDEAANSPLWSEKFAISSRRVGDLVGEERLGAMVKELHQRSNFMAMELDVPPELAQRMAGLMGGQGYKVVYGAEFNMANDLIDLFPEMGDITRKQMRSAALENFFARREPTWTSHLRHKLVTSSLHAELAKPGVVPVEGRTPLLATITPDGKMSGDMRKLLDDLYQIMEEAQADARGLLDTAGDQLLTQRFATRVALSQIPLSLDRLPSDLKYSKFLKELTSRGYSESESQAIFKALSSARHLGFREEGLWGIETYLRSRPNLGGALRLLSNHPASSDLWAKRAATRAVSLGAGIGGFSLGMQQYNRDNPSDDPWNAGAIGAGLIGGAIGKMATTAGLQKAGLVGEAAGRLGRLGDSFDQKWLKYSYLADNLANIRDRVRFTLSPIFDASRYSEAVIIGQLGYVPEGLSNLRLNQSPKHLKRVFARKYRAQGLPPLEAAAAAKADWDSYVNRFAAAAKGDFEWEMVDSVGRRFSSVGILGFSPAEFMASTYANLLEDATFVAKYGKGEGASRKAYEISREIHTYGLTGRSPAELSMNFVFFPFSFTKKVLTHAGRFMADDMSRLVVLHDMAKTYEQLSENYDLGTLWKERLPILDRMNRLNILAYGISPGRFGGINAPILETLRRVPVLGSAVGMGEGFGLEVDAITNMFIPQMVPLQNRQDSENLYSLAKQLLPVMNDITTLSSMLYEQGRVIGGESHMTAQAELTHGWDEWREFQGEIEQYLATQDMTWASAMRIPEFNQFVTQKRVELADKYPSWQQNFGDGIAHATALELELDQRIQHAQDGNPDPGDFELFQFAQTMEMTKGLLAEQGISFDNPGEVPPAVFQILRGEAIRLASQPGPGAQSFVRLYNRFYRRLLGDITKELL